MGKRYDVENTYISKFEDGHKEAIKNFKSSSEEQNDFILNDALEYSRLNLGSTYLLFDKENNKPLSFITLGMGALKLPDKSSWIFRGRKLAEYPKAFPSSFPALKIGQLATQEDEQGKGAASLLIDFATTIAVRCQKEIGCAYLLADAHANEETVKWYEKRGFMRYLTNLEGRATIPMYVELGTAV